MLNTIGVSPQHHVCWAATPVVLGYRTLMKNRKTCAR